MKRYLAALSAAFLILSVFNPSAGSAIDMSAGMYTWYAWWDFPEDTGESIDVDPDFIYGPVLSLNINESVNMTFVFLYGAFDAEGTDGYANPVTYDIDRIDSDTAINFRLNSYLKVYAGVKYSAFYYVLDAPLYEIEFEHETFGPGAGVSFSIPIVKDLFITGNAGGLYLWGTEKYKFKDGSSDPEKFDIKDYGYNAGLSLAWFIEPVSTTVSLGGRYQYIKTEYDDGFENSSKFYGITLSASYIFSL